MRSIDFYIAAVLMTSSLVGVPSASLVLADDPPSPNNPSDVIQGDAGKGTGAQEEPAPPAEATDIQERGIRPGLVMPGATLQITAPTPSLTAIRNAIRVTSKSVSVNLRISAKLPVTVPVEVSVAYLSPAQTKRLTKTYSPATGLTLLYREAEGDGKPRAMTVDITVRELVPNGQSFSISKQFTITPLYQVEISPLRFLMFTQCDTVGKSDITFWWRWPDGQQHEQKFDLGFGETKMVNLFSWGRREFSAQANLTEPVVQFDERDFVPPGGRYVRPIVPSNRFLVPGKTQDYSFILDKHDTGPPGSSPGSTKCKAQISYRITRTVLTFDQF